MNKHADAWTPHALWGAETPIGTKTISRRASNDLGRLFSVIIPAYNSASFIGQALESVYAQTLQDFELIVVDDGSTDNTWEIIQAWKRQFGNVLVADRHSENRGPAAARNAGIRKAKGEFVAFLDSDDLWVPDHLAHAREAFLCHGRRAGLFAGLTRVLNTERALFEFPWPPPPPQPASSHLLQTCYFQTSTVCVQRDLLIEIGGFAERLTCHEDWLLFLKLSKRTLFVHSPCVESIFRRRDGSVTALGTQMSRPMYRDRIKAYLMAEQSGAWSAVELSAMREPFIRDRAGELADYLCSFDALRVWRAATGLMLSGWLGKKMWLSIVGRGFHQFARRGYKKVTRALERGPTPL